MVKTLGQRSKEDELIFGDFWNFTKIKVNETLKTSARVCVFRTWILPKKQNYASVYHFTNR